MNSKTIRLFPSSAVFKLDEDKDRAWFFFFFFPYSFFLGQEYIINKHNLKIAF